MTYSKDKKRVSLYLKQDLLDKMDQNCKQANCRSRNEFIIEAVKFYLGYLNCEEDSKYLIRSIDQSIQASVKSMEDRTAKLLFKIAVEMSMMMHLLGANLEIDEDILKSLRAKCVKELNRSIGNLNLERIVTSEK